MKSTAKFGEREKFINVGAADEWPWPGTQKMLPHVGGLGGLTSVDSAGADGALLLLTLLHMDRSEDRTGRAGVSLLDLWSDIL